jgi:hypothetical protein
VKVKLKNNGGTEEIERREVRYEWDEIAVEDVPFKELVNLQLEGGVRVKKLGEGKWKESGIREGFIISHIDKIPIDNVDDLNQVLEFKKGGILIEGYYPNNEKGVYGLEW